MVKKKFGKMSVDTLCRLCVCPFHDCKKLFDENGQCNEAYDIATKYFDPMVNVYENLYTYVCTF